MKKIFLLVWLLTACAPVFAQTVKEWTRQKETKIEYLLRQISLLKTYSLATVRVYQTAKQGLGTIDRIRSGDLALHADHVARLRTVSPAVVKGAQVLQLFTRCAAITKQLRQLRGQLAACTQLTSGERGQLITAFQQMAEEVLTVGQEAISLLTSEALTLDDASRLQRLVFIAQRLDALAAGLKQFSVDIAVINVQRHNDHETIKALRQLGAW